MQQPPEAAVTTSGRGHAWKAFIGIAFSVGLLYFAFRNEDPAEIAAEIAHADIPLLALATAAGTFVFWVRAWRWRSILQPIHPHTSFRSRFAAVTIGFMGNNLLPARVGELMRAYALSRQEPIPIIASVGSLVIERLFDGLIVIGFLFLAMALPDFPVLPLDSTVDFAGVAATLAIMMAVLVTMLFGLVLWPERAIGITGRIIAVLLPARFARLITSGLETFLAGLSVLRDPVLLLRAFGWSVVLWLLNALSFWLAFRAFDMDLSYTAAVFFQSCIALAVSVPSAPGFFGPFEAASKAVLGELWGVEGSKALGFAIGFHVALFIPVTLIGLYYAWRIGFSLKEAGRAA